MPSSQVGSAAFSRRAGDAAPRRQTVLDIFQSHIKSLSHLPGEVSQFEETGVGYEWRCQLSIGEFPSGQSLVAVPCVLQLHFSLIDLEGRSQPVAVLYLVEQARDSEWQERLLLSLSNPGDLHEELNSNLLPLAPTIDSMAKAASFIDALAVVKDGLGSEVDWI